MENYKITFYRVRKSDCLVSEDSVVVGAIDSAAAIDELLGWYPNDGAFRCQIKSIKKVA